MTGAEVTKILAENNIVITCPDVSKWTKQYAGTKVEIACIIAGACKCGGHRIREAMMDYAEKLERELKS